MLFPKLCWEMLVIFWVPKRSAWEPVMYADHGLPVPGQIRHV